MKLSIYQRMVYSIANTMVRFLARIFFLLKVFGRESFPKQEGVLVACNHISFLDPPLVHSSIPRRVVHSMAKEKYFRNKFLNWFMTSVGTIPVDARFRSTIGLAVGALGMGHCVLIFPEGTRSRDGKLNKGDWGTVSVAIRSNCFVVPTAIIGSQNAFPVKGKFKFSSVKICFGKPYKIYYHGDRKRIPACVLKEETSNLMKKIEDILPENMRPTSKQKQEWYGAFAH